MSTGQIVALVVVLVLLAAVVALLLARRRRTAALRGRFGPEYDRVVERTGDRRDAERRLAERQARAEALELRPLPAASRERYQSQWIGVQTRFVDAPESALGEADRLITQLMRERGFPEGSAESSEELLSVRHTRVVDSFRAGHAIEEASRDGRATTEQVRQAMLHFREVFEELLGDEEQAADDERPGDRPGDRDRDLADRRATRDDDPDGRRGADLR